MLGGACGADMCCNDISDGHGVYTGGVMEQYGGLAAVTTWPVRPGQALDVFFDGKDSAYQPGYYRGIVDVAGAPTKRGIQKLDIDFPDDRTNAKIDLKRSQLYAMQKLEEKACSLRMNVWTPEKLKVLTATSS